MPMAPAPIWPAGPCANFDALDGTQIPGYAGNIGLNPVPASGYH